MGGVLTFAKVRFLMPTSKHVLYRIKIDKAIHNYSEVIALID
jgi:hypothetical protein